MQHIFTHARTLAGFRVSWRIRFTKKPHIRIEANRFAGLRVLACCFHIRVRATVAINAHTRTRMHAHWRYLAIIIAYRSATEACAALAGPIRRLLLLALRLHCAMSGWHYCLPVRSLLCTNLNYTPNIVGVRAACVLWWMCVECGFKLQPTRPL